MPGGLMPTYNDRGFPLYGTGETFPGWAAAFNSQSNLLGTALDVSEAAVNDAKAVPTLADIPDPGDSHTGQIVMVEENDMLHLFDGTGWYAFAGRLPYYFGSRSLSPVGTGAVEQVYITATDYARGVTMSSGILTFETPGIYRIDQAVTWEANGDGQRNLGVVPETDSSLLGPQETAVVPSFSVYETETHTTYILVSAPGATVMPYVTHNSGVALDVKGSICVMWVSG